MEEVGERGGWLGFEQQLEDEYVGGQRFLLVLGMVNIVEFFGMMSGWFFSTIEGKQYQLWIQRGRDYSFV